MVSEALGQRLTGVRRRGGVGARRGRESKDGRRCLRCGVRVDRRRDGGSRVGVRHEAAACAAVSDAWGEGVKPACEACLTTRSKGALRGLPAEGGAEYTPKAGMERGGDFPLLFLFMEQEVKT
ncbi:MAG: hypothetical protein LBK25_07495 [Treponema sp.]|nr:hypothetical protein [Treponema sp.]